MNISRLTGIVTTGFTAAMALAFSIGLAEARPQPETARASVKKIIVEEALASNIPPSLALAVAKVESDFQAHVESSKGARGVMQIMPATGRSEWGVDAEELWDPRLNVRLGIDYLEQLIERYNGNWELALSFYNGGSKVGKPGQARVLPWTRKYVDNVLRWEKRYAAQEHIWMALMVREDRVYGKRNADRRNGKTSIRLADNRHWPRPSRSNKVAEGSNLGPVAGADENYGTDAAEVSALHAKIETRDGWYSDRPRVRWTNLPNRKRINRKTLRQNRKSRPAMHNNSDFRSIEQRRQAVRKSLDDFS